MGAFFAVLFVLYSVPNIRGAEGQLESVYSTEVACNKDRLVGIEHRPTVNFYCVKYDRH
jgi:hypothetical protein